MHWNLLLPLLSDPSEHTNISDTESVVDQTVSMHGVIAVDAVASHVQDMTAYCKAWVADMFQQGCYHSLFNSLLPLFLNNE